MFRKWGLLTLLLVMMGVIVVQPAMAQSFSWQGEYYNNSYLQGSPAFTRTDNILAFDWGNNAPGSGVNSDGFSVRWTAITVFNGGTYRFWALADDYIRITLDDGYTPILSTFGQNSIGQIVSADVNMTAGVHKIRVDYQEVSGNAYAYVNWAPLSASASGPNFPVPQVSYSNVNNGAWTAQYYANPSLSGSPTLIQSEASPSHNWGSGSPVASIPADNWSARWTSTQALDAGQYQLTVRADDGVRVYVDGVLTINEWHSASNVTYSVPLNLTAGNHNFQVEFYEAGGDAFLDYNLSRISSVIVNPPVGQGGGTVNTGTTATVTAARLNVRDNPSTSGGIIAKINLNETYPVIGKTADGSWYQISVNGLNGWVSSRFVRVGGNPNVQVVTSSSPSVAQPVDTGYNLTALTNVNIRNAPATSGSILAKLLRNEQARVVGRNANNSWWQINAGGVVGWVSAFYTQIQPNAELARIPVTG